MKKKTKSSFISTLYDESFKKDLSIILAELPQSSTDMLFDIVYNKLYKRKYLYENTNPILGVFKHDSVVNHNGEDSIGWKLNTDIDDRGCIIVSKQEYTKKRLFAGTYLKKMLKNPNIQCDEDISIKWIDRGKFDDQYIHFYGKSIPDEFIIDKNHIRVYFNINPNVPNIQKHLTNFCNELLSKINLRNIPFEFKVQTVLRKYYADAGVLYFERRYYTSIFDIINELHSQFDFLLRKEVPMFTYPLMDGIGFAENPPDSNVENSFGIDRSRKISEIIIKLQTDTRRVTKNGIFSLINKNSGKKYYHTRYYLNSNSRFEYFYLANVTKNSFDFLTDSKGQNLKSALVLGFYICKEAYWDSLGRCNWVSIKNKNTYQNLGVSYLDGLAGVVYFLSELYKISKNGTFLRHGLAGFLTLLEKFKSVNFSLGFQKGSMGVFYAIFNIIENFGFYEIDVPEQDKNYVVFSKKEVFKTVKRKLNQYYKYIVSQVRSSNHQFTSLGMYEGLAGTLYGFLLLKEHLIETKYLTTIADYIVKLQVLIPDDDFVYSIAGNSSQLYSWENLQANHAATKFFTGLGHGAIGIAYALQYFIEETKLTKNDTYIKCIDNALLFEKSLMKNNQKQIIWIDFSRTDFQFFANDDCEYGTFGGIMARLAFEKLKVFKFTDDLKTSREFITENRFASSSLFNVPENGYFDILIDLFIDDEDIMLKIKELLKPVIQKINDDNFFPTVGTLQGYHSGLVGLSGLGCSLLRLNNPHAYSSVFLPKITKGFRLKKN